MARLSDMTFTVLRSGWSSTIATSTLSALSTPITSYLAHGMETQLFGISPPKRKSHNLPNINTQFPSFTTPLLTSLFQVRKTRHLTSGRGRMARKSSESKTLIPTSSEKFPQSIKLDLSLAQTTKHSNFGPQIWRKSKLSLAILLSSLLSSRSVSVSTFQAGRTEASRFGETTVANRQFSFRLRFGHWLTIHKVETYLQGAATDIWGFSQKICQGGLLSNSNKFSTRRFYNQQQRSRAWVKMISRNCHWPAKWVWF